MPTHDASRRLEAEADRFWAEGACVVRDAISPDQLAEIRTAIDGLGGDDLADLSALTGSVEPARFRAGLDHWRDDPAFVALATCGPLPSIAAAILRTDRIWLYEDSVLVKEPGSTVATRWHTDDGYFHVEGRQLVTLWVSVDPAPREAGSLRFLRGSHHAENRYRPTLFVSDEPLPGTAGEPPPQPRPDDPDVFSFDLAPGDLTLHHARTLHASPGNATTETRRALSVRYCGDDAVVRVKVGAPAKPGFGLVESGTPLSEAAEVLGLPEAVVDPVTDALTDVRIADLRRPRRDADEQSVYDFGLSLEVHLDPEALIAEACRRTNLSDFADDSLIDRLDAQVAAIEADVGLSGLGRLIVRRRLIGLLSARLRFEDFAARHPETSDVVLDPPVVVVGLPRSGTTHLVNLLAADTRFRSLPWWECIEPTPFAGDGPGRNGLDPRFERCLADYESSTAVAPLTNLMHDRHPSTIEEECELMDLDLCSYTLEWHARVPAWRDHYLGLDHDAHYRFLRRELQVLSYVRGPGRFVLKTPQHLEQLGPLMRTFPDATLALTLRDPVAVFQSAVTMLAYGDRLRRIEVEPDELAEYWLDRIERLLRTFVGDLDLVPEAQRVEVEFGAFMADETGAVERILDAAGLGLTDQARDQIGSYAAANPRGRQGRVVYDLRADFGLEPDAVRDRFGFYFDRFPQIRPEVR